MKIRAKEYHAITLPDYAENCLAPWRPLPGYPNVMVPDPAIHTARALGRLIEALVPRVGLTAEEVCAILGDSQPDARFVEEVQP